ncbi:unnamed protein product [Adineta steineri]|uniref:Uncharacterized protein n=1 Tax=Adineta steineri TaxID=433720 RepID=A0A813T5D1_9BILA|nr:unnamed protein product [Adineta steineri]CAF1281869.1 unnamed protein product [Adineta steineri]
MAEANTRIQCSICNKGNTTYICRGCSKDFNFQRLTEHRPIPRRQLNEIINDHDQFQQIIIQHKQNLDNSSLIQQINQWETNSIHQIQQTAEECRETVMKLTQKLINNTERKFIELSQKLKEIRQENEFNEIDLNHFQLKLKQMKEDFLQSSNISIRQDSQQFIKKISVISSFGEIQIRKTKFQQFAITVAKGNEDGQKSNQISDPQGIFFDNDKSLYIVDYSNDHIVRWKLNSNTGQIIEADRNGNENNQLNLPRDIIFEKENNSFIISDFENKQVIRYFDQNQTNQQIIISNIYCFGLAIDKNGYIYVSDWMNHEVRRWKQGDENGELVAGGHGKGNRLNQLNYPTNLCIDEDYSLYISDGHNHRVMKWKKDAKEGIIVAGGKGYGNSLKQLSFPRGVIVNHLDQIYVADRNNNRIMRWCEGDKEGEIVVGGNGRGMQSNQLSLPTSLLFDNEENLYVVDYNNHRI